MKRRDDDNGQAPPLADLPMFRTADPEPSKMAAAAIAARGLGKLQRAVLQMFFDHGRMTARAAEQLPEARPYGFSTVRKRISELAQKGFLMPEGTEGSPPATLYRAARWVAQPSPTPGATR